MVAIYKRCDLKNPLFEHLFGSFAVVDVENFEFLVENTVDYGLEFHHGKILFAHYNVRITKLLRIVEDNVYFVWRYGVATYSFIAHETYRAIVEDLSADKVLNLF